jgi:hypothetical protein
MALDIPAIASKLNDLAVKHLIGQLQGIRKQIKNLERRPGGKIFTTKTIFPDWAFHHGGRTELQFNIGYADRERGDDLRHGVAFSFELNQTLQSIDVLVPQVKFFNDFMALNAAEYRDMRMWHHDPDRSEDRPPGPVPPTLVRDGVFVFLGSRQPASKIDYEKILDDFDRLLPLYRYVETRGASAAVPLTKTAFRFQPGFSEKVPAAKATLSERELDLDLRHNRLQAVLYERLAVEHGKDNVRTEQPSGAGTLIDVVVRVGKGYWFYEIKTALTPRACLREAVGQLLEYGFWPGAQEPARLIVVGETAIDPEAQEYLDRIRGRFSLPIEYEAVVI